MEAEVYETESYLIIKEPINSIDFYGHPKFKGIKGIDICTSDGIIDVETDALDHKGIPVVTGLLLEDVLTQIIMKKSTDDYCSVIDLAVAHVDLLLSIETGNNYAYYSPFDKGRLNELLKKIPPNHSYYESAQYLMESFNIIDLRELVPGRPSKRRAMEHYRIDFPIPFDDSRICPGLYWDWVHHGNINSRNLDCLRNKTCVITEKMILEAAKHDGGY